MSRRVILPPRAHQTHAIWLLLIVRVSVAAPEALVVNAANLPSTVLGALHAPCRSWTW